MNIKHYVVEREYRIQHPGQSIDGYTFTSVVKVSAKNEDEARVEANKIFANSTKSHLLRSPTMKGAILQEVFTKVETVGFEDANVIPFPVSRARGSSNGNPES